MSVTDVTTSVSLSATDQITGSNEMPVTDITTYENNISSGMSTNNNDDITLEMFVEDVTEEDNLSLAMSATIKNVYDPPKNARNFEYTNADYKSLLQNSYSTETGFPFKNGFVMYVLDRENSNLSKAFKYLMDLAAQKNYPYRRSIRIKIKRLRKSVANFRRNLALNWPRLKSLLEEKFEMREPVIKKKVSPDIVEPNPPVKIEAEPEMESSLKPLKCIKCERLRKSLREVKKSLQEKIRDSKQLIRQSRNVKVKRINEALKRKVVIIKKVKSERCDLRRQQFLLQKDINRLNEKLQLKYRRLSFKIPFCPRPHGEELRDEIRNKKTQIKKMESVVEKLQSQLRSLQEF